MASKRGKHGVRGHHRGRCSCARCRAGEADRILDLKRLLVLETDPDPDDDVLEELEDLDELAYYNPDEEHDRCR